MPVHKEESRLVQCEQYHRVWQMFLKGDFKAKTIGKWTTHGRYNLFFLAGLLVFLWL